MSHLTLNIYRTASNIMSRIFVPVLLESHARFSSDIKDHINEIVKSNKVVVFMKGCPDQPMCGFSNAVAQIFRMHNVQYDSHDVLKDDALRQGIKEFSNWPTIPQVYINGQFVGGCDILLQMHQSGELIDELQKVGITSGLLSKAVDDTRKPEE